MTITQVQISTIKNVANGIAGLDASAAYAGKIAARVSVKDFGAVGDGVTDDLTAFNAALASLSAVGSSVGGEIIIPSGRYYLSGTWGIRKRVSIIGTNGGDQPTEAACALLFPKNVDGVRFFSVIDSGTGTDATNSRMVGIEVQALEKDTSGCGIKATTTVSIEHCFVRDFALHGIEFYGEPTTVGITDFWRADKIRVVNCGGHGLYSHGNDSQIGLASQVECIQNGGYGFYETSPYGSTYIACQAAGNDLGSFYNISATTYYGSQYIGCYVEFGNGQQPTFDHSTIVIGGTLQAVAGNACNLAYRYPGVFGLNVPEGHSHGWFVNNQEVARINPEKELSGLNRIAVGEGGTRLYSDKLHVFTTTAQESSVCLFDNPNGRVGAINTAGFSTSYNTASDYRLKSDVKPMRGALEKIALLNPVTFKWKNGDSGQGFIAHELQGVFPEAVTGEKDGELFQSIDPSFIIATMVAAVQELKCEIDAKRF